MGKIGVPDRILRKPGTLTTKELDYMRQHPLIGSMMISQHLPESTEVKDAVASHHERWDGTGYPARLRERDIPLLARILAVADAYSAMTTDRPYQRGPRCRRRPWTGWWRERHQFDPDWSRVRGLPRSGELRRPDGSRSVAWPALLHLAPQIPGLVDSLKLC